MIYSKSPTFHFHKTFEVSALNLKILTYVGYFGSIRLLAFLSDDTSSSAVCGGDDERVGDWGSFRNVFLIYQRLKMGYLKYLCDE